MTFIPPPWAPDQTAPAPSSQPSPPLLRMPGGTFPPGVSGNPSGPRVGSKQMRTQLAASLLDNGAALLQTAIDKAMKGDASMLHLCLSRLVPTLKPKGERVTFSLDTSRSSAAQARQVLDAVAAGELDVEAGKALTDAIANIAQLRKFDDFERQLQALQEQMQRLARRTGAGSQVLALDLDDLPGAPVYPCED